MLGLTLFAPRVFAQDELVDKSQVQETDQEQGNEDAKNEVNKNKETEKTNDDKKTAGDDKTTETSEEQKVKVPSVEEQDSSNQEVDDILTADEIQEIRTRTNSLENSYFFNGNMVEELKAELRKAKADSSVNYEEAKARLIDEAIQKNTPAQKAPGEERTVKKPKVNPIFLGNEKITGSVTKSSYQRKKNEIDITITVTVNRKAGGSEVKTVVVPHDQASQAWSVTLDSPLVDGDKVTVTQAYGGETSNPGDPIVPKRAMKDKYKDTLHMPEGEIWIEQYVANIVNDEEKAEALDLLKQANPAETARDIKSVEFNITNIEGEKVASYIVTYTDNSKTKEIAARNLKINQVKDYSRGATLGSITIVDNVIKGKLAGPGPFDKIKVQLIVNVNKNKAGQFCNENKCTFDKTSSTPVEVNVQSDGTFSYTLQAFDSLTLDQIVGVSVKEPHKFVSCSTTTVKPVTVEKTEVKDPRKLTPDNKTANDEAIRKAYTLEGVSKLPNGTGDWTGVPAVIQIDDSGNAKIFSGNDVAGDWDNEGTFVPEKNGDGSYKVKEGAQPKTTIPAKDILKNIKPDAPNVAHDGENGSITITPNVLDTDAKKITVKYTDNNGESKTATFEKTGGNWSKQDGFTVTVDDKTGQITITVKDDKIKNKSDITATVTDAGGIADDDTDEKTSDPCKVTLRILPKKPKITINDQDGSVTITPIGRDKDRVAKKMVIGYSPVGNREVNIVTVDIDENGNLTLQGGSDFKLSKNKKSITITNDKIKSNTKIKAITNDGDPDPNQVLESDESEEKVPDKTAPQPPKVEVNTTDGSAQIKPPTDKDTKTVIVKYPDPDQDGQTKTAIATKGDSGWEITQGGDDGVTVDSTSGLIKIPYDKMKKADTLSATAKDESNNESKSSIDTTLPPAPGVKLDEENGVITVTPPTDKAPSVDGMEITYTPDGDGASETKLVAKKDNAGKWSIENIPEGVAIDKNTGVVTITNDKAKEKSKVIAYSSIDTKKKSLEKGEAKVPESKAPEAPTVKVQDNGSVTITPKDKGETTVTVTYKDKDGQDKTATATKGKNGKWTVVGTNGEGINEDSGVITIPNGNTNPGDRVKATATKGSKTSEEGKDLTKPAPPKVTPNQTSGDVTITPPNKGNVDGMIIKYKKPNGNDETIKVKKGEGGTWTIENNPDTEGVKVDGQSGLVTIKKGHAKEKTPVTADSTIEKLQTPDKNQGDKPELVPDKTPPQAPEVSVNTNDGSAQIKPPTDEDTKTITVKYPDPNGNEKTAIATKDNDGWKITKGADDGVTVDSTTGLIKIPYGKMKKADTVSASAKDESNNESQSSTDTTLPPVPSVEVNTDKKVVVTPPADTPAVNGMEITYTPAGKSQINTIKIVKGNDDKWKLDGDPITGISVDETSGKVTFDKGTAKELSNVIAKSKIDENKKGLETAEKQVPDTTAPEKPDVKVQDDGSVTITPKKDSDTKTVTVTYKNQDGEDKTATATKDDKGNWTVEGNNGETIDKTSGVITIPKGKSNPGDKVVAKAKDPSGNESGPSDDTTMPAPPTITPDQTSGNVTITPPTKGNLDGMDIEYKTPEGTDRKVRVVKGTDKKWKIEGENPDEVTVTENQGIVTIPKGKAKEKTEVKADSTLGKKKAPAEKTPENQNLVPDKTAPNPPTVKVEDKGNVTITPPSDEDTTSVTVTYKKADNTEIQVKAKKSGNKWSLTKVDGTSQVDNGESVDENSGVIALAKGKYKTGEIVKAYGNDNVNNQSSEDKKTPVEVSFEANGGSKTMDGSILALSKGNTPEGQSAVLSAVFELPECKFAPPEGKKFAGWQVGSETKKAGEKIQIKANTTVKAIWKDIEFKVTFQTEAGASGTMDPKTVNKGSKYELPTPTFKSEEGKEFAGWKVGDGTELKKAGEAIDISGDVKLTAVWKDIEYKVSFNANGGSETMKSQIVKKGKEYTLPANGFIAPEGKEFDGWMIGTEKKAANDKITINADTEVKAIWKDIEYKVSFNGNTGTGKMDEKLVKKGKEYTLPANGFIAPEGKEFDGWMIGTEKKAANDKITINADTEVKAIWKDIEYKVSFNGNSGTGKMAEQLVKKGKEYTLPANGFTAPEGKKFDGWMIGKEKKAVGDKIKVNADAEVKAVWKDIEYKVSFNGNSGTGNMAEQLVKKGNEYELPKNGFTAPKDKVFDGWMIGEEKKAVGDKIKVNADTEVKAIWKDIEYKVSFNGNSGTGNMAEQLVKKGNEYELPKNGFTAPKDKVFDGWMIGEEKKAVGDKIKVNADTEVKAIWKDIEYKVSFNGNSGTGKMAEQLVKKGKEYTLPANGFTAPEGKKFDGWMIGKEKKAVGDKIKVNADAEVKAVWKDIEYKVSFNGNSGTGKMAEQLVKKGNEYELPENGFTAPEGKEFDGWMIGTEKKAANDKITINADTEVKAIWKDIEYKVSFNGNSGTGSMTEATVKKGEKYKLPGNKFQAPTNKEFKTWEVDGKEVAVGTEITVDKDIEVKAVWKDKKPDNPPAPQPNPEQPGEKPVEPGKSSEEKPSKENPSPEKEKEGKKQEAEPSKKIPVPQEKENKEQAENKAKNTNPNVKTGVESLNLVTASLVSAASALFMTFKKKKND
ncbi:InlB B-repeat-containing protein [Anaerococcus tetradius]|uniref:InlB B-repeat-containing protein n=1 Tax=Anaerococcus tetradius TaxID=33036 RepID=UPI0023F01D7A|nr:InlB B-repeat-containing protein [Anaerococcus tetradius]